MLKKHNVTYRILGHVEVWTDSAESAKKQVRELNKSTNLLIGNLNREDLDIINIEVMDTARYNLIALIDHYIQKWSTHHQTTYAEILKDTNEVLRNIDDPDLQAILIGMMEKWEKEQTSLFTIERNLHMIRKLLS